jgi:hypothetical protein
MTLKIAAVLAVVALLFYGWYRNDLRRLTRDFARQQPFDGKLHACLVRFPLDDTKTDCLLGANDAGLYMTSSSAALKSNGRWSVRYYVIRTPLFIPWSCVQVGDAKFPLRGYFRFSVPSNKATFFVPREIGERLLGDAGRTLAQQ